MPERVTHPFYSRLLSGFVLAGGIVYALTAVWFGVHFYSAVPFADTWNIIDEIVKNHNRISPGILWAQHNEHRMAVTRLLMWADLFWARGKGYSLFLEIYAFQAFTAFLLTYTVLRAGKWSRTDAWTALGVALFSRFYLTQYDIFTWSFCIQVVPTYALETLSYIALTRHAMTMKRTWLAVAIGTAFLAPLNLAGGQAVWLVLCLVAWDLRLKGRTIVLLACCGAISIGTYLVGYVSPAGQSPLLALQRPGDLLQYFLLYFAASWDALSRPAGYVFAAAAILGVIAWNVKVAIRRDASPLRVALLALSGSLIINGFLTALGRINLGIEQSTAGRYQTAALLFWCCIFLLCMDLLFQFAPSFTPILAATSIVLMVVAAFHTPIPWQEGKAFRERLETGGLPMVADVKDDEVVSTNLAGAPFLLFEDTGFMRLRGLSFYDSPEYRRMGARLVDVYAISSSARCVGNLSSIQFVPDTRWPGYRALGWGWNWASKRAIGKVVITNESGRIIGLGRGGILRSDSAPLPLGITSSFVGWRGYVNGSFAWQRAQAYGELPGGNDVCSLPGIAARP